MVPKNCTENFEEELLKRRLVADGDGRGDDKKIGIFIQSYVAWATSNNPNPGDDEKTREEKKKENANALQKLRTQMLHIKYLTLKTSKAIDAIQTTRTKYNDLQAEIREAIETHKLQIIEAKEHSIKVDLLRQQQGECKAMILLLKRFPQRKSLEVKLKNLTQELNAMKEKRNEFESKITLQKQKLALLIQCSKDLSASLDDDRPPSSGAEPLISLAEAIENLSKERANNMNEKTLTIGDNMQPSRSDTQLVPEAANSIPNFNNNACTSNSVNGSLPIPKSSLAISAGFSGLRPKVDKIHSVPAANVFSPRGFGPRAPKLRIGTPVPNSKRWTKPEYQVSGSVPPPPVTTVEPMLIVNPPKLDFAIMIAEKESEPEPSSSPKDLLGHALVAATGFGFLADPTEFFESAAPTPRNSPANNDDDLELYEDIIELVPDPVESEQSFASDSSFSSTCTDDVEMRDDETGQSPSDSSSSLSDLDSSQVFLEQDEADIYENQDTNPIPEITEAEISSRETVTLHYESAPALAVLKDQDLIVVSQSDAMDDTGSDDAEDEDEMAAMEVMISSIDTVGREDKKDSESQPMEVESSNDNLSPQQETEEISSNLPYLKKTNIEKSGDLGILLQDEETDTDIDNSLTIDGKESNLDDVSSADELEEAINC